jgi:hypothetical protein
VQALDGSRQRGLLPELSRVATRTGSLPSLRRYIATLNAYLAQHAKIVGSERDGHFSQAIATAVGPHSTETRLASRMNTGLGAQVTSAQRRFRAAADTASADIAGLWVGIPLLVLAAITLVIVGFRQRLGEYR